jgi:UDP-N-acetylglucosamine diphosphorylase/glucosamine-1-phosphate N-acetyltransferase
VNICIFEDFLISRLHPVNHLRHTSEIICGAVSLKDKIIKLFKPRRTTLYSRNYVVPHLRKKYPDYRINELPKGECLFLNARVVFNKRLAKKISESTRSALWAKANTLVAINAKADVLDKVNSIFSSKATGLNDFKSLDLNTIEAGDDIKIINYPSDLILHQEEELRSDLANIIKVKKRLTASGRNMSKKIAYDTSSGSVYIGKGTVVEPFCYINGPVYIGTNCTVKSGTSIYGPVSIGDWCKVSGEITNSILHSHVNKQHLGFLGHSYICEWVNLGAGTTTSNLKNNYSKIVLKIGNNTVNTDSIFLGSIIGDHTKTGINTMLNTGTLAGISCNLFGSGFHRKLIKSFSWADASSEAGLTTNEKAIQTVLQWQEENQDAEGV